MFDVPDPSLIRTLLDVFMFSITCGHRLDAWRCVETIRVFFTQRRQFRDAYYTHVYVCTLVYKAYLVRK